MVLYHAVRYRDANDLPTAPWLHAVYSALQLGHLGVPLFFVISGFCIHLRWARTRAEGGPPGIDFYAFWRRRLYRLYPPYLVALILCMGMVVASYVAGLPSPLVDRYPEPRSQWMGLDFLAHVTMLHGLHPLLDQAGGNVAFWTLAREEYFYLMYFALLAWRCRRGLGSALAGVLAIGLVFRAAMSLVVPAESTWRWTVETSALVLWIQWCLGMVAVEAYYGVVTLPRWCRAPLLVFVWAGAALLCDERAPFLTPLLWGLTFFTLINYSTTLECAGLWPGGRALRWLEQVGIFSYSLYLIHYPVRSVVKRLLGPLAATQNPLLYLGNVVVISVAGYVAGLVFFRLVEKRFLTQRNARAQVIPLPPTLPVLEP